MAFSPHIVVIVPFGCMQPGYGNQARSKCGLVAYAGFYWQVFLNI
jgi:hypothetical protein